MILNWGPAEPVVSRVMRNMKGVGADYMEDIKEWIAEAIGKMKTPYTVSITPNRIQVRNHRAKLPCKIQGLVLVEHRGCRLTIMEQGGQSHHHHRDSAGSNIFKSIVPIYTSSGDLTDVNDGRSKYPRDLVVSLDRLEIDWKNWYRINGPYLETNIEQGELMVWTAGMPKDQNGFPLVPEVEEYEEAIYRYIRMMLIEAGYEDKVMSHASSKQLWEEASGRAISAVSFPTPEETAASINRNVRLFGAELDDFFRPNFDI